MQIVKLGEYSHQTLDVIIQHTMMLVVLTCLFVDISESFDVFYLTKNHECVVFGNHSF